MILGMPPTWPDGHIDALLYYVTPDGRGEHLPKCPESVQEQLGIAHRVPVHWFQTTLTWPGRTR